jgi:hypothetical protein
MVEDNHNIKNIDGASTLVKGDHGVVVAVHVMIHDNNSTLVFRNGTTGTAPIEFTIHSEHPQGYIELNRRFENGIYVTCASSTVRALVVYK